MDGRLMNEMANRDALLCFPEKDVEDPWLAALAEVDGHLDALRYLTLDFSHVGLRVSCRAHLDAV